jgi:N-acetyl-1-D-myo-inositol-2-amino-2-deoxy-alpha-D-glucopyranoside deacetylase
MKKVILTVFVAAVFSVLSAVQPASALQSPLPHIPDQDTHPRADAVYQTNRTQPSALRPGVNIPGLGAASSLRITIHGEMDIPEGTRALVFSPHPDDETIAAGGFMQQVIQRDGKVRLVFMTNGDGYVQGVQLATRRTAISSEDFVRYGVTRHDEALRAACDLGLTPADVLYLGYPDDGINKLWTSHWSRQSAYTSPHTLFSHAHYRTSFRHDARYDGFDLGTEIERVIRTFKPDWIVLPDPRDQHPDHAATGVFVLDALRRLGQRGDLDLEDMHVYTYLVHYGDYPVSNAWTKMISTSGVNGSKVASEVLSETEWVNLPLTQEEQAVKKKALGDYVTQIQVLGDFLKEFLLPAEIFGRLDAAQIMAVPQEYIAGHQGVQG